MVLHCIALEGEKGERRTKNMHFCTCPVQKSFAKIREGRWMGWIFAILMEDWF